MPTCAYHPPLVRRSIADVRERFIVPQLEEAIRNVLIRWASETQEPKKIIDLGCGNQPYRPLIEELGFDYRGLDIAQNETGSVHYVCALDKETPYPELKLENFDYVLCSEVLEHIANWESFFKNMNGCLKKKGKVLITCPFFFPLHTTPHDFWRPTFYGLQAAAERFGYRVESSQNLGQLDDVLGLLLGHMLLSMEYNSKQGVLSRLQNSLKQRLVRHTLQAIHWLVRKHFFTSHFLNVKGLYLSNVVVLEKI